MATWGHYVAIRDYKKSAIKAAEDFNYGDEVIRKIKQAETIREISDIMEKARVNGK